MNKTKLTTVAVNAQADALGSLLNAGFLDLFDGTPPADSDAPIMEQRLLASVRFGEVAFKAAVDGVIVANDMTACSVANATGTASWARCYHADHSVSAMDVSVGERDATIILNDVRIYANSQVSISVFRHSVQRG